MQYLSDCVCEPNKPDHKTDIFSVDGVDGIVYQNRRFREFEHEKTREIYYLVWLAGKKHTGLIYHFDGHFWGEIYNPERRFIRYAGKFRTLTETRNHVAKELWRNKYA